MPNHPQREEIFNRILTALRAQNTGDSADQERLNAFASAVLAQSRTVSFADQSVQNTAQLLATLWQTAQTANGGLNVQWANGEQGLVITTTMPDQPFIIDTIRKTLRALGAGRLSAFQAVLKVTRTNGLVVDSDNGNAESVACFEAEGLSDGPATAAALTERLQLAQAMTSDFAQMGEVVEAAANAAFDVGGEDAIEGAEFLRWTLSDNFVFLGITVFNDAGNTQVLGADRLAGSPAWQAASPAKTDRVVDVRKGSHEAPVHRNGRVDVVRVSVPGSQYVIRGMFTHRALTQPCRHLPILRRVLDRVLTETQARPNSYRYRGLANIFDTLPTEWLFSASVDQLRDVLDRVFEADQERVAQAHITQENGTTFALIAIPERRYSDNTRTRILHYLTTLTGANYTDSGLFAGRFDTVLIQVYQTGTRNLTETEILSLQTFVMELSTPFSERLAPALEDCFGNNSQEIVGRYADAFPPDFSDDISVAQAAQDIVFLERSRSNKQTLAQVVDTGTDLLLRVYQSRDLLLTELMPIIDNFGLIISDQYATPVNPKGQPPQQIDTFRIAGVSGLSRQQILDRANYLVEGLDAVFQKHINSDAYNRLILAANLSWQQVDLIRGIFGYARQLSLRHPLFRVQEILLKQAEIVSTVVQYFDARFNPDLTGDRAAISGAISDRLNHLLGGIQTADEDTVLRTLTNLVESMIRTNFYRTDRSSHYISFKVDHSKIKLMPQPRMWREIYVHHREVEGLHLRGGPIARGGIRFSDRTDFRTEILGLVSTQMVKNVVIVPEGSKGGFYIKYIIDDPAERKRKGDELYQILIRGMLDMTDNIVNGAVVRPPRVVAHDGDDPYLVVAADKGTAHLSDTANRLSLAYGFWLGDAFASGGSNGYDHKVVGITARGAWVLVKRLFREMGKDADTDEFTCVGIGDTAGDVFGNGVIETRKMKLLAAFNHAHIFFDPNPDPEVTYVERRRLFDAVRGWDHYNTALISKGGGIFSRRAKSIPLSPEVKAMLGTLSDEVSPEQAMNLILKMPVDLLWNGGIGTYVRATTETNADANDPSNDEVRVTATELRAKVIGEGGNLGFTQAARVEYALNGGRLNTDFVDNSGGVDTSDHEVNLKILLNPMVASGRITMQDRNDFLRSLTDEVAQAVLSDCNANGRLISLDVVRSTTDPLSFARAIDWIIGKGSPARQTLVLPSDDELRRRAGARQSLTRPELAVLQAHLKMHLFKMLMQEDSSVIPGFDQLLQNYFPTGVRARFGADVPGHMLAKAIGMTVLLTEVMTDAGCNFFPQMLDLSGAGPARVAGAWRQAMQLLDGDTLKTALVNAHARPEAAHRAWTALTSGIMLLVSGWLAPGASVDTDPVAFQNALDALALSRSRADNNTVRSSVDALSDKGIPKDVAEQIINRSFASQASELLKVAAARGESLNDAAVRYQAVGAASGLLSTLMSLSNRRGTGRWDPVALGILGLRYRALLRDLVIADTTSAEVLGLGTDRAVDAMSTGNLRQVATVVERILGSNADVGALLVAEQQIRAVMA